ncbi:hypothetical protein [Staphylococcus sp. Mo2-1]
MKPMRKALITSMFTLFISSTTLHSEIIATEKDNTTRTADHLKLIDTKILPFDKTYKDTKVGGLSGITYDPKNDKWLLMSDDRSEHNPSKVL